MNWNDEHPLDFDIDRRIGRSSAEAKTQPKRTSLLLLNESYSVWQHTFNEIHSRGRTSIDAAKPNHIFVQSSKKSDMITCYMRCEWPLFLRGLSWTISVPRLLSIWEPCSSFLWEVVFAQKRITRAFTWCCVMLLSMTEVLFETAVGHILEQERDG